MITHKICIYYVITNLKTLVQVGNLKFKNLALGKESGVKIYIKTKQIWQVV